MTRPNIISASLFPSEAQPFTATVRGATQLELAALRLCWLARPATSAVRPIALDMLQREVCERLALDPDAVLTEAQREVLAVLAPGACRGATAWQVVYRESDRAAVLHYRRDADSPACCAVIAPDGRLATQPATVELLAGAREVTMRPLLFNGTLPLVLLETYSPTIIQSASEWRSPELTLLTRDPAHGPAPLPDYRQDGVHEAIVRLIPVVRPDGTPVFVPNPIPGATGETLLVQSTHGWDGGMRIPLAVALASRINPFVDLSMVVVAETGETRVLRERPAWID